MRSYRELVGSVFMRSSANGAALLACVFAAGLAAGAGRAAAQGAFSLTSTDLKDGAAFGKAQVYDRNDCTGRNVSPELSWRNAPAGTKSFAVTVFDIDAPGPGWWHWAVAAIPPSVTALPANASASGYLTKIGAVQARNDWGDEGYGGPCPPPGKLHRYVVTVFALNTADLRLGPGRHALMFDHEINTAALAKASLTVTYQR
ncbi:YbhB/YbcL family Raf kinase inhibitor-like protein [Trinickia dabaoshanensis]|uniref:YbhB/YbcL family Raf kinase inhibitor-like protein n=2 Tax=Trinickia dabaoshanensis TaxID=564714 RepID=A0A2N7VBA8_9BURK|nr:YbhB/YbcL family Raf kinase inhibitor-like protein [Trinickia dabaoshanensis]PMS14429.1 YbhB/YbcL family Raf kinase inhibitor-like protein [Trinickia dabaoshanensis]